MSHGYRPKLSREATTSADEHQLIERLLGGDEKAFNQLVDRYHPAMMRVARMYCGRSGTVEEVVQDTWVAVLKGLPKFQRRSSLKTWIFRILSNRAKSTGVREKRTTPMSALTDGTDAPDPDRFAANGSWATPPASWTTTPEKLATDSETAQVLMQAIGELPDRQRLVITLRDVQGMSSAEVCNVLEINDTNQRVLLHRARTKVRSAMADYLDGRR